MNDDLTTHASLGPQVPAGYFPPTRWSIVVAAKDADSPEGARALEQLCRTYWYPAYTYLRRLGSGAHDAEDLVQGFFISILQRRSLATVEESKGRLRSFLLVALKRFVTNAHISANTLKRGGGHKHFSIEAAQAEQRFSMEPATQLSPDRLFEREWAVTLLDAVLKKLRAEYVRGGREEVFETLKDRLTVDGNPSALADAGARIGLNEGAAKVALYRLRQRYRKILHDEIAATVDSPEEVHEEIRHLFDVFRAAE